MKISILTLFPEIFKPLIHFSIIKKAIDNNLLQLEIVNIRDFSVDKHKSVDDHPYGGGVGMIMRVDIIDKALEKTKSKLKSKTVLLDPRGSLFNSLHAESFAGLNHLILVCGHYEGVDERVLDLVDETVSVGDYILSGGEIPAMLLIDAVTRLIPGVLKKEATREESFKKTEIAGKTVSLLSFPQYTKPRLYKTKAVPEILLSGDHKKIKIWREKHSFHLTAQKRPDLLK